MHSITHRQSYSTASSYYEFQSGATVEQSNCFEKAISQNNVWEEKNPTENRQDPQRTHPLKEDNPQSPPEISPAERGNPEVPSKLPPFTEDNPQSPEELPPVQEPKELPPFEYDVPQNPAATPMA